MGLIFRSKKYLLVFVLVAVIAVYFFARFILQKPGDRSEATPGVPTLSYSIEPQNLLPGDIFDLIVQVNPNGASFYAFELYAPYDGTKADVQNTSNPDENISSSYILVDRSIDVTNNFIKIVGTRTGSPFTGTENIEIARVSMRVNPEAVDNISFGWDQETRLGDRLDRELQDGVFFLGSSAGGSVDFHLDIPSIGVGDGEVGQVLKGQNLDVNVLMSSDDNPVKGFDFVLPYDPSRFTFQNTADLAANIVVNPDSGFRTDLLVKKVEPAENKIYLSMVVPSENGVPVPVRSTSDVLLATLKLRIRTDAQLGLTDLTPDQSASMIINTANENILNRVGTVSLDVVLQLATPTPVITGSDQPAQLKLKLRFPDLVPDAINSQDVEVELRQGSFSERTSAIFARDGDYYVTQSPVVFVFADTGSYDVFVKARTTLGRVFANVNLTKGTILDCTFDSPDCGEIGALRDEKILPSGDSDGFNRQSGSYNKVDSADLQAIAVNFNQPGTGPAAIADYNLDGRVEISDLEIIGKNYGLFGD